MAIRTIDRVNPRSRLTRERVQAAAIAHADAGGLEAITMRGLAEVLEVAPMALYRHVANREDLVDAMVDVVFSEIHLPSSDEGWQAAMRRRALSAREVLARHPWAIGLMEARVNPGPATLRHHDAMIGRLRQAGFSIVMAAHAYSLLDSYIYGFAIQEASLPIDTGRHGAEVARAIVGRFPIHEDPHLAEGTMHLRAPGDDDRDEFTFGLDVILDGLEKVRQDGRAPPDAGGRMVRRRPGVAGRTARGIP
jgi:AcrR family transcriptional regulator